MSLSGGSPRGEDGLHGSWVEVEGLGAAASSRRDSVVGPHSTISSLLQGELEKILLEAQLECERSGHADSSPSESTPQAAGSPKAGSEGSSSTDSIIQLDDGQRGLLSGRQVSAEWVWDWSSRPENQPPKEFMFQRAKQSGSLSVRKSEVMKKGFFSTEVLLLFIPSLLTTHLLTLGLGIYLGKRLAASSTSTL